MANDSGRVLVVDGNEENRDWLTRSLQQQGYRVSVAQDGHQALAQIPTVGFDAVVLDPAAPEVNGFQVLQSLRADNAQRHIPIIILSRDADERTIERYIKAGAADVITGHLSPSLLNARIAAFIERKRLREEVRDHLQSDEVVKIERDMHIARQIQAGFLPEALPQPDGWEIAARFEPAREVAGDFYDAFMLTQNRRVGFVMADVCDKGVGAALFMALFRSLTRAFAQQHYSLSWMDVLAEGDRTPTGRSSRQRILPSIGTSALKNAVVQTNNYIINNHASANMFATMFFGVLDPASGALAYVNGGHNPPYLVGPEGLKEQLKPTGPAVGMLPDVDFGIEQTQFEPGDVLLTYTDGVPEARAADGAFFTDARLLSLLEPPAPSASALLDRIQTSLQEHTANAPKFDDVTMLAVRRKPE